jgi:hypothetical protein
MKVSQRLLKKKNIISKYLPSKCLNGRSGSIKRKKMNSIS